jgi:cytochrome P450
MTTSSNETVVLPPLFSPEFQRDPYPTYRHYLKGPSLQPLPGRPGVWMLFGYEACATVMRDQRLSAARPASALVAVDPQAMTEFDDLVRHMQRWLLLRDAPSHAGLRKRISRGFSPVVVQSSQHRVEATIDRRNLIGNGLYTLLKHPDVHAEIRNDERLTPAAIEELLRYESPIQAFGRMVKSDLEVDGVQVPVGSGITFMIGAAHRDPRQYPDPDRLDVRRPHNRHLAFGGDAHVCLGSTLARLEGRLAIGAVTRRFPNLQLVNEQADWGPNFAFRGLSSLLVRV